MTPDWASDGARQQIAAGSRMPLTEPGVRLSLRAGLSIEVYT
jgi:hypothetical protein